MNSIKHDSFSHSNDIDPSVSTTNVHRIFTPDTEQQISFSHSMNIDLNVSISNIHCIFTLDIKTQVSIKSSSILSQFTLLEYSCWYYST